MRNFQLCHKIPNFVKKLIRNFLIPNLQKLPTQEFLDLGHEVKLLLAARRIGRAREQYREGQPTITPELTEPMRGQLVNLKIGGRYRLDPKGPLLL